MIRCEVLTITAGTSVANAQGTAVTGLPIVGEVISVRNAGTALGGTCDYTLTRVNDGGTVLAGVDMAGPWQFQPTQTQNIGTALAGTASAPGIPCASHLRLVIGSAVANAAGTVHIYYRQ